MTLSVHEIMACRALTLSIFLSLCAEKGAWLRDRPRVRGKRRRERERQSLSANHSSVGIGPAWKEHLLKIPAGGFSNYSSLVFEFASKCTIVVP